MINKSHFQALWKKQVKFDKFIILIVIAIAVGLTLGIYMATKPNQKLIQAANEVISLSEDIRKHYRNRPDYWRLNTETVVAEKIAPKNLVIDGKIKNSLDNEVLVGSGFDGAMVMPGTRSFDIVYKNLSKKDCVALASYSYNEEQKLGLLSISIKNDENISSFTWGGENKFPISTENAKNHCENHSEIYWTFE